MAHDTLVAIRGLTLDARTIRGTARLLHGIDLDIGRGRILGIVGESGSGKSSLASCLLRLLPGNAQPPGGSIAFDGVDLLALGESEIEAYRGTRIAMIFQDPMTALNPLFTVEAQLGDVLRRRSPEISQSEIRDKIEAVLVAVGIADAKLRMKAYPHQLSGGMRQRAMIAMALLVQPDLLLADEPTTALDATVEAQIVELIGDLRREFAGSILFISHHLGLVSQFCDDVCVMYAGTVAETGPVDDVCRAPLHPYTKALLACEIEDDGQDGRLVSIPGEVPDPIQPRVGCVFAPRCTFADEQCRRQPVTMRPAGGSRTVACHHFERLR
jgi:peptide/nickel transport system ATP-binding protein